MHKRFNTVLCHSTKNKSSKIESAAENINYPNEIIENNDKFGTSQRALPTLRKYKPNIIIAGIAATNFTFYKLLFFRLLFNYKIIAWGHGIHNNEIKNPLKGIRGKLMQYFFKKADAIVFYNNERKQIVSELIPSISSKLFTAQNTLDTSELKQILDDCNKKGIVQIKKNLHNGFSSKHNVIFIGRLLENKGIQLILQTAELLSNNTDLTFHLVGSGDMEEDVKKYESRNKNLVYHGAIYNDNITGKMLYVSDLFLMPGYLGLSIAHAFAFGTPVISCKSDETGPFHSPEIEYLESGTNGILCDKDPNIIAKEIMLLLENNDHLEAMKQNALQTAYENCTLDNMMEGFEQAITFVSK